MKAKVLLVLAPIFLVIGAFVSGGFFVYFDMFQRYLVDWEQGYRAYPQMILNISLFFLIVAIPFLVIGIIFLVLGLRAKRAE